MKDLNEKSDWLLQKLLGRKTEATKDEKLDELSGRLQQRGYLREKIRQQESFDYLKAYRRLMLGEKKKLWLRRSRWVAVIVVLLGAGIFFWRDRLSPVAPVTDVSYALWTDIRPGQRQAVLRMHDGRKMKLTSDTGEFCEGDATTLHIDSLGLHYEAPENAATENLIFNTLEVPRGGEYFLTLADGTQVWLNADTELKYPVRFGKNQREVEIRGEAYFKVAKDAQWPFVVKTTLGEIRVLGTEFNVSSYEEDQKWVTTLVKGSVACTLEQGKEILLQPDQQLVAEKGREAEVRKVDARFCVGWKDGIFQFRGERLEDIMKQLARWYDVRVFYTCEAVKNLHFSGDLSRFKNIGTFIEMFEKSSDVKFSLSQKTVVVGL